MSFYGDYILEREGKHIIENDDGFITYKVFQSSCYIENIYVIPARRRAGAASALADQVVAKAKESGCTLLLGTVDPHAYGSTESLRVLLAYGFKISKKQEDALWWFFKEIL